MTVSNEIAVRTLKQNALGRLRTCSNDNPILMALV